MKSYDKPSGKAMIYCLHLYHLGDILMLYLLESTKRCCRLRSHLSTWLLLLEPRKPPAESRPGPGCLGFLMPGSCNRSPDAMFPGNEIDR